VSTYLVYGIILGAAQTGATLLVFALGLHSEGAELPRAQMVESVLGFLLLIGAVALGLRAARRARETRGEFSSFGAGARSALALALFGALATGLGQALYIGVINPAHSTRLRDVILRDASAQLAALPPEQAEAAVRNVELAVGPLGRGLSQGLATFFFATILGLAFAVILRAAVRRDEAGAGSAPSA
jgi:hypothetical protein